MSDVPVGSPRLAIKILFVCVLGLATLVTAEVAGRLYAHLFFHKMIVVSPDLGWRHAESVSKQYTTEGQVSRVTFNKTGTRGPDYGARAAAGKRRVLVLGDSFTEGSEVGDDEVFTSLLARSDTSLEVINAGVSGYGTVQEYLYLVKQGLALHPDLVLVMVYDNDFFDNCQSFYPTIGPRPFATVEGGDVVLEEHPSPDAYLSYALPVPFASTLNRYSLAYNFINAKIYQPLRAGHMYQLEKQDSIRVESSCDRIGILTRLLARMQQSSNAAGAAFAVALVPTHPNARQGLAAVHDTVQAFCSERAMRCQSLVPPLHDAFEKGGHPYFERNIHWTREGHRVVADAMTPLIREGLASP